MSLCLSEKSFLKPIADKTWLPLLEFLQAFQKESESPSPSSTTLQSLHDQIVSQSAVLLEEDALVGIEPNFLTHVMVKSLLLLSRLTESVGEYSDFIDTAGSKLLPAFDPSRFTLPNNPGPIRKLAQDKLGLSLNQFDTIMREVDHLTQDALRKKQLINGIKNHFSIHGDLPDVRDRAFELFDTFHPNTGLSSSEVDLVITGNHIFFCLPVDGSFDELKSERINNLPAEEQERVTHFLKQLRTFKQKQYNQFPSFDFLEGRDLPDNLLRSLAKNSQLSVDQVAHEISSLTTILPLIELDKYLLHDVWGHSWQASVLDFEDLYGEISQFSAAFSLDETPNEENQASFEKAFLVADGIATLDASQFTAEVHQTIQARFPAALTPILAEMLADIAEYKFIDQQPDLAAEMSSSSIFKFYPVKLDFLFQDLVRYFSQSTKTFRLWSKNTKRQEASIQSLIDQGASETSARECIAGAIELYQSIEKTTYAPTIQFSATENGIQINEFTRAALNFASLHGALLRCYQELDRIKPQGMEMETFKVLLLVATGVFFEEDPTRNLWRVDEFVAQKFVPLCELLGAITTAQ